MLAHRTGAKTYVQRATHYILDWPRIWGR